MTDEIAVTSNAIVHSADVSSASLPSFLDALADAADAAEASGGPELDLSATDLLAVAEDDVPAEIVETAVMTTAVSTDAPGSAIGGYSVTDLELFRTLTGYRLDTKSPIWRAVDDSGQRASIIDRLFTTLAEEAFRFADRQRRSGLLPDRDLTADDLALTLGPIRRAAAVTGSRGLGAFDRLEAAVKRIAERNFVPQTPGMDMTAPA